MSMPATSPPVHPLHVRHDGEVPVLVLPSEPGFETLRDLVRDAMPELLAPIGGRSARLDLGERELVLFDLRRLVHLLKEQFAVDITGLYVRPGVVHRYAERELKLKLFFVDPSDDATEELLPEPLEALEEAVVEEPVPEPTPAPVEVARPEPQDGGRRTLHVHRTLRSGANVRYEGDVLVFGDVNPGAQVIAAGNIVVLGALKGLAHAGATGDEDCFILGFNLDPTQVRIGRRIAIPPPREVAPGPADTEIARVVDGEIVIEPYRGRLR